ncbi:MAG: SH3 domain-containing protein [Burkholderiales bacterium]|nr:SH3 domain-containing protein [Anaerolineae bacterium]
MWMLLKTAVRAAALAVFLPLFSVSGAQDSGYAAVLRINFIGVEVRLANTEEWLSLPANAETPLGPGDSVRTNGFGRAMLTFLDDVEVFVLPDSTLELLTFGESADGLAVSARLRGHTIQRVRPDREIASFQIESSLLTVTSPAELFAVWAQDDQIAVVTVAQGQAEVSAHDQVLPVTSGQGIRVGVSDQVDEMDLGTPLNAARLIGLLDGCPGAMQTSEGVNVNVRVGPDIDSTVIGNIADEEPVRLLAIGEYAGWYRIQAFSGFGWVQYRLVGHDCEDLIVLPSNTIEHNIGVFQLTADELALLQPFYGPPEDDLWFYRSIR